MTAMTIAHATSFAREDQPAFEHALALACAAEARLVSVHAHPPGAPEPAELPSAARVLSRWGKSETCVEHHVLVDPAADDPIDTLLGALRRVAPALVVTGTHQRHGVARLLEGSAVEAILKNRHAPMLVVPMGAHTLVTKDGELGVRRMVIPAGDRLAALAALEQAAWLGGVAGARELELVLVAAGGRPPPAIDFALRPGWRLRIHQTDASVEEAVVVAASDSCVIVMATRGTDSLADALFGTHTEHVLRTTRCPVLVVPIA